MDFTPAKLGDKIEDILTPALILDLNNFEHNLKHVHEQINKSNFKADKLAATTDKNITIKPHAKSHKSSQIAKLQIESGCTGICVAKVSEAIRLAENGIEDITITNEIVSAKKITMMIDLLINFPKLNLVISIDNFDNAKEISEFLRQKSTLGSKLSLNYLIEVNVGQNRCGLEPGKPVAEFLKLLSSSPETNQNLNFLGLLCYQGWNQHIREISDRKEAVLEKVAKKVEYTLEALEKFPELPKVKIVTGGGTGTFMFEGESGVYNELQPGSYCFMDKDYGLNEQDCGFKNALYLLSSICSINKTENFLVLDAGWKSTTMDSGVPSFKDYQNYEFVWGGDEHSMVKSPCLEKFPLNLEDFKLDQKIWLIPGHCDPTVNLHDFIIGVRDGVVEKIFEVDCRGPGF